jgi:hypothetical protein
MHTEPLNVVFSDAAVAAMARWSWPFSEFSTVSSELLITTEFLGLIFSPLPFPGMGRFTWPATKRCLESQQEQNAFENNYSQGKL